VPFVAAAVGVVAALLIALLAFSPSSGDQPVSSPVVGKFAPQIAAKQTDGKEFSLKDLRGGWVLVNFFATWCEPCREEHPQLRKFEEEHAEAGDAQIVSVLSQDDASNAKAFFAENGGNWPVVLDTSADIALSYGLVKLPESYLVDPNGVIEAKVSGEVTAVGLDDIIAKLEGKKP
jgi:cytochrome c biogenesis protein CcmG/thiol:disulfide interchange protein DsbE